MSDHEEQKLREEALAEAAETSGPEELSAEDLERVAGGGWSGFWKSAKKDSDKAFHRDKIAFNRDVHDSSVSNNEPV